MATQNEEFQRIRGYLQAQAAKLTVLQLVEKVRADTAPLREVGDAVPPDRFGERPGSEDWSAAEVYTHVLRMNEQGAASIEGILDSGALPPRIDDVMTGETRSDLGTPREYWQTYLARRERLLERVLRASGEEHLDVMITHPMFGPLNWREWLLFMRVHDLDHMRQLQAVTQHFAT